MKTFLSVMALLLLNACTIHVHNTPYSKGPVVRDAHPSSGYTYRPTYRTHRTQSADVRAWVWTNGKTNHRGRWVRGYWALRTVPRHMLKRHPHTHVPYRRGFAKPSGPPRRNR